MSDAHKKTIFITGVAGFIGSNLADLLLARGFKVIGIDNFCDFYDPAIKRRNIARALSNNHFTLVEGDIRDIGVLRNSLHGCDYVLHFAAMAGVRPSLEKPFLYQDVNVGGTLQVLEACRLEEINNIIFASSSSVYGNNSKVPFSESDPVDHPISIYAATKKAAELLCHTYHAVWGLDITCLRLFTVYGPRQRPDLAIHKFSRMIVDDRPIPFFGDGSMERDHTYIDDILQGVEKAIAKNAGSGFRIINLGSDHPVRLDALVSALENVHKKKAILEHHDVPPGDVLRTWADISLATELLGYHPRISLDNGLKRFTTWMHSNY